MKIFAFHIMPFGEPSGEVKFKLDDGSQISVPLSKDDIASLTELADKMARVQLSQLAKKALEAA